MKELNYVIEPNYYDAVSHLDRQLLIKKEVELGREFGIHRLTRDQKEQFNDAEPGERMIIGLGFYDMLYNQKWRNNFEWNQQIALREYYRKRTKLLEESETQLVIENDLINYDKLSTMTMLALNRAYVTCPDFDFD